MHVKKVLKPGENELTIVIKSAIKEADARNASSPYPIPAVMEAQAAQFNWLRKPASDFGWDWGPAFAPAGVYGDIDLVGYSDAHLVGANVRQAWAADGKSVTLTFDAVLQAAAKGEEGVLTVVPASGGGASPAASPKWAATGAVVAERAGTNVVSLEVRVAKPFALWWPVGYGAQVGGGEKETGVGGRAHGVARRAGPQLCHTHTLQPLYKFDVVYEPAGAPESTTALTRRVGFRRAELVRRPIPAAVVGGDGGETFYFKINGVPIYAKGTNMIPDDIFASRTGATQLRRLVADTAAANMNMIRVWGGGLYPLDAFYDACDEAGILVWQEFMAACAMYPRDEAFLEEVRKELTHQARRINWHPSLIIWGGNNEIEAAFNWFAPTRGDGAGGAKSARLYVADYVALFVDTVRAALRSVDPAMIFVDTSPSKGVIVDRGADFVKRWGDVDDARRGDVHFYTTKDNALNYTTFPRAKFVSEFGFQSLPSWSAIEPVTEAGDWSYNASAIEFRQRHPGNTGDMLVRMGAHYQLPPAWAPPKVGVEGRVRAARAPSAPHTRRRAPPRPSPQSPRGTQESLFRQFIYLTQVYQATAYQTAASYWRRIKSEPDAQTMGVLYWQLNDIWPGYSWSSLDQGGGWKLLHYAVRRFFAPFLASGAVTPNNEIHAYATSDVAAPLSGRLVLEVVAWSAGKNDRPLATKSLPFTLAPLESKRLIMQSVPALLKEAGGVAAERVIVRLTGAATAAPPPAGAKPKATVDAAVPAGDDASLASMEGGAAAALEAAATSARVERRPAAASGAAAPNATVPVFSSSWEIWLTEPKDATINPAPGIEAVQFAQAGPNAVSFVLRSAGVAPYVALDAAGIDGVFSDNSLLLLPWEPRALTFTARAPVKASDLQAVLEIMSLADTLQRVDATYYKAAAKA